MHKVEGKTDRKIFEFPPPFSQEMSPYKELEFSETVKTACSHFPPNDFSLRICKVIILGDLGVGKTSLVSRFCRQIYNYNYKTTIGVDFELEKFHILNVPFNLQLWDTSGQERFKCIAGAYYRSAHAIITVFDLGNFASLTHCTGWLNEALECNSDEPLKFLVGTKRDLLTESNYNYIEKEAGKIARLIGAEYWAASSKTGWKVTELFTRVAALTFERLIRMERESTNHGFSFRLGNSLSDSENVKKVRRRDVHCEMGGAACRD